MFRKSKYDKLISKSQKYLNKQKYLKAKQTYLEALAIKPDDIGVLNNLAQLHSILGEDDKAESYNEILLKECDKLLKNDVDKRILILKCNALVSLDRMDESNEIVDELLKIDPANYIGLFHKAQYLELHNKNREAITHINQILKENPYNIPALLSKGRNHIKLNEFDDAEKCFNLVLQIETKNKTAINLKSELLKRKYNLTLTSHDFMLKAIEHWEMNKFKNAEEYFKKAIFIDDAYDEIWFAQGELMIRMGKLTKAIESFNQAFELNQNSGGITKKGQFFRILNWMRRINILLGFEKKQ